MRVEMRGERYCVGAVVNLQDNIPIEYLKQDMCRKMANQFFDDGLVTFEVQDDRMTGRKVYRGTMEVLLPIGIGRRNSSMAT